MKRVALLLTLALFLSVCLPSHAAEVTPVAVEIMETLGEDGSYVRSVKLTSEDGAQAPTLDAINAEIASIAHIDAYLSLLQTIASGGVGLRVDCEYALGDRYFSVLISAEGKMLSGRPSQVFYPMCFDLTTGARVAFAELFTDAEAAKTRIEEMVSEDIAPMLSTYLENTGLFPIPYESFFIADNGDITFCYENADLSFLSGRSGAVSFTPRELMPYLRTDVDSPLADLWMFDDDLITAAENSRLAGLARDIAVGDSVDEIIAKLGALSDSGYYPGGAYIEPEDARLRGTYILTDEAETTVTGILSTRVDLFDIRTGVTTREAWRALIGQPNMTMPLSGAAAQSYLLCDGESDYYLLGARQLILHADMDGVLYAILVK